jgi:hypothetical protein
MSNEDSSALAAIVWASWLFGALSAWMLYRISQSLRDIAVALRHQDSPMEGSSSKGTAKRFERPLGKRPSKTFRGVWEEDESNVKWTNYAAFGGGVLAALVALSYGLSLYLAVH